MGNSWVNAIRGIADAEFILLLIPGNRGKDDNGLYSICKRLLLSELGISSQVLLTGTVRKGKGLTSVISKVLSQMCAKCHLGAPWGLLNPETFNEPTVICGIDVWHGGNKSVLAFTSSLDIYASRYFSITRNHAEKEEIGSSLTEIMDKAIR